MERSPDPIGDGAPSKISVAGHPLHPMLVTFPVALLIAALASDVAFWFERDPFWARMSLWLVGSGTLMGVLAGLVGTVEVLVVRGIRRRAASWSHFVAAVMLLSVGFANWAQRVPEPHAVVLPWGLYLSALGAVLVALSGWLGGALVFEHRIGVVEDDGD